MQPSLGSSITCSGDLDRRQFPQRRAAVTAQITVVPLASIRRVSADDFTGSPTFQVL
jgi:hypothetical protein